MKKYVIYSCPVKHFSFKVTNFMGVSSKWYIQARNAVGYTLFHTHREHRAISSRDISTWSYLVPLKLTSVYPLETHDWQRSVLIASMT